MTFICKIGSALIVNKVMFVKIDTIRGNSMVSQDFDLHIDLMLGKIVNIIREDLHPNRVNWAKVDSETTDNLMKLDEFINEFGGIIERHLKKMAKRGYVYLMLYDSGYYKIGETKELGSRLLGLRNEKGNYHSIEVIHAIETDDVKRLEYQLHEQYASRSVGREMFDLSDEDVLNIQVINSCFYEDKGTRNIQIF